VHPLRWLSRRDRDLAALRRAGRAAIVMPAMFALGDKVIAAPALATAVRMIWTGDHLDAARRLQRIVVEPAREATRG
jgi:hypothetical protein